MVNVYWGNQFPGLQQYVTANTNCITSGFAGSTTSFRAGPQSTHRQEAGIYSRRTGMSSSAASFSSGAT